MKQLRNRKGMTLVEIIVVLLIMSVLLVIMGSLILNAFNYFNKTTDQDLNKRSLDAVSEYVRSELLYATDVRVQENVPDENEWNSLYIVDGQLYRNDEPVYSESFYNYNQLVLKVRGFDKYRLDLKYAYYNADEEKVYATMDTLELLNLKLKIEKDDEFNPFANISSVTTLSKQMKIYYQKNIKIDEDEKPDYVESASNHCVNAFNNRGRFERGNVYKIGDMIFSNGYWWLNYNTTWVLDAAPENQSITWKKMDYAYDARSVYMPKDILKYENRYFQCIQKIIHWTVPLFGNYNSQFYWQELEKEDTKVNLTCSLNPDENETVSNKLDYEELDDYEEYEHGEKYDVGEIVKITSDDGYVEYYLKVLEVNGNNGPLTNPSSGWQKLVKSWDAKSSYKKGDIVAYSYLRSRLVYIEAQQDIVKKVDVLLNNSSFNEEYWKQVYQWR
ncbi:MAG: type II secretion system protein [Bacilli bacterium]|nr:type II secretion system protein [Bacilli bacterium]